MKPFYTALLYKLKHPDSFTHLLKGLSSTIFCTPRCVKSDILCGWKLFLCSFSFEIITF